MKRITILLVLLMLTVSTVGCGCFRRLRDRLTRGAYCGPAAVAAPAELANPVYAAPTPVQAPVYAPAPMMMAPPAMTNCVPCDPCCVPCDPCCVPCDPCCDPCGCGYGGYYNYGGMSPINGSLYDSGWSGGCEGCSNGYTGESPSPSPTPAPASSGRDPSPAANDPSL